MVLPAGFSLSGAPRFSISGQSWSAPKLANSHQRRLGLELTNDLHATSSSAAAPNDTSHPRRGTRQPLGFARFRGCLTGCLGLLVIGTTFAAPARPWCE